MRKSEISNSYGKLPATVTSHAAPIHVDIVASPLSKDSPEQNYRGFLNLAILLLVVNNLRLIFENFLKYGFLISTPGKNVRLIEVLIIFIVIVSLFINLTAAYWIERGLLSSRRIEKNSTLLIILNCFLCLASPTAMIWYYFHHPVLGISLMMMVVILFMKLVSYHLVNHDLRTKKFEENSYDECKYPKNITFGNILYFWFAPTLCYQPVYPRIPKFRKSFFLKRVIEYISSLTMVYFLMEQYAVPTVMNSMKTMENFDLFGIIERMLKLSVSSLYIWLLMFYAFFHSFLNALSEVLLFGDRSFYKPWWNANSIEEYWRLWNLPVHNWFKRHVYYPLRSRHISVTTVQLIIFLLSAIFHEFLILVPTKITQFWSFIGMMMQFPMILMTSGYLKSRPDSSFGNFFFWISFCIVGQPMAILLYYRAWINKQYKF